MIEQLKCFIWLKVELQELKLLTKHVPTNLVDLRPTILYRTLFSVAPGGCHANLCHKKQCGTVWVTYKSVCMHSSAASAWHPELADRHLMQWHRICSSADVEASLLFSLLKWML